MNECVKSEMEKITGLIDFLFHEGERTTAFYE